MNLKTSTLTAAVALAATLGATASAEAATGYTCTTNSGAVTCPPANRYTGPLYTYDDAATSALGVTPIGTITCTNSTAAGNISLAGPGPLGTLTGSAVTLTSPGTVNNWCNTTLTGIGTRYVAATVTGTPGVTADWNAGSPTLTISSLAATVALKSTVSPYNTTHTCLYNGSVTGPVNNATRKISVSGTLARQAGSTSGCPISINYSSTYANADSGPSANTPIYVANS